MFSECCSDAPEKQRLCLASHPKHRFHHSTGFQMRFKFLFHLASVLLIHVAQEAPKCVFLVEPLCPILMKASTGCLGENKRHSQGRASEERLSQTTQFMQWLQTLPFQHRSHSPCERNTGDNTWRKNSDTILPISQERTGRSDTVICKPVKIKGWHTCATETAGTAHHGTRRYNVRSRLSPYESRPHTV